jgi:transposase-like protein
MKQTRRKLTNEFKMKVAMEALQEKESIQTLCKRYSVTPNQIRDWKNVLKENGSTLFGTSKQTKEPDESALISELYRQIGELKVDNDFLKKKLQQ